MTEHPTLQVLRAAGCDIDALPEEGREVLRNLSPEELNTLVRVAERLAASPDVQAFAASSRRTGLNGCIFF
jgi:hypothetical protein